MPCTAWARLPPSEVTLQFHIAALMLNERALEAEEVDVALTGLLSRMSTRTRRPIRFVVPEVPENTETAPGSAATPESDGLRSRPRLTAV